MSLGLIAGLLPVAESELEEAGPEPVREQVHELTQVGFGLDELAPLSQCAQTCAAEWTRPWGCLPRLTPSLRAFRSH
jgi:hypothetical protein